MMARERGCQVMLTTVYNDPRIIAKSREFINLPCCRDNLPQKDFVIGDKVVKSNPMFPGATVNQCVEIESRMRDKYQKSNTVVAPQHVFTKPDGKLLFKKEYWLTVDQMLALMDRALRMHKGLPEPPPAEKKKDPEPAADGKDEKGQPGKPDAKPDGEAKKKPEGKPGAEDPDGTAKKPVPPGPAALSKEAERLLSLVIAGPLEEKKESAQRLLEDERPEQAKALVDVLLGRKIKSKKDRQAVIRAVNGKPYGGAGEEFARLLALKDMLLRNCVVVTLEEMESAGAVKPLLAHFKKERDKGIKNDVIRALGPCGMGNEEAKKFLLERLKGKNSSQRTAAAMALGSHLPDKAVIEAMSKRYRKESGKGNVKLAIYWAYMMKRDETLVDEVRKLIKKEKNGQTRAIGEGVIAVIEGRPPEVGGGRGGRRGGGGRMGGYWRLYRMFTPLFAKDRVERKLISDLRNMVPGRGRNNRDRNRDG
jgi:hypothetical protein